MRLKILVFMVFGLITANTAFAQQENVLNDGDNGWEVLGSKKVNWKVDKDVLLVGPYEGVFNKLKIKVTGGTVHMIKMVVTYGNGMDDEIPLRHVFERGSTSRVIDLKGKNRVIKKITFVYDRKNISRGVKVWVGGK